MKDIAAVPKGERPDTQSLIHRGGCVSGPYALWMQKMGVDSAEAVQGLLEQHDIDPVSDTVARAADEKYNRPEDYRAYLCLSATDARKIRDLDA